MKKIVLPPVVSVVGWSNSGKTTFLVQLVRELKARGYRVATVKHHHGEINFDQPGKDTWQHARAGADAVALTGAAGFVLYKRLVGNEVLNEIARMLPEMDIILTEGFKSGNSPKIEVRRREIDPRPAVPREQLIAMVDEEGAGEQIPCFTPEDYRGVADLLEKKFLRG